MDTNYTERWWKTIQFSRAHIFQINESESTPQMYKTYTPVSFQTVLGASYPTVATIPACGAGCFKERIQVVHLHPPVSSQCLEW